MSAAIINSIEWQWWLVAALAFIYGSAVMALVFRMLFASIKAEEKGEIRDDFSRDKG